MGLMDSMKSAMAEASKRNNELHITLKVTSGKKLLNMGFSDQTTLRQNDEGQIYIDTVKDTTFTFAGYEWDGPVYKEVVTETSTTKDKGKAKTKGKGGLGGAIIGTMIMPGVGTVIGAAATRKKVTTGKGKSQTNAQTETSAVEIPSPAKITLKNNSTGESIVIGVEVTSAIDAELLNFNISNNHTENKSNIEKLKEYKELLDLGIITQAEFDAKKAELL